MQFEGDNLFKNGAGITGYSYVKNKNFNPYFTPHKNIRPK